MNVRDIYTTRFCGEPDTKDHSLVALSVLRESKSSSPKNWIQRRGRAGFKSELFIKIASSSWYYGRKPRNREGTEFVRKERGMGNFCD